METPATASAWRPLYVLGAVIALVTLTGTIVDIALTMVPGFDPSTVPADAAGWLAQLAASPLVGLRNLDLLNVALSAVGLPLYGALAAALRRTQPGLALAGLAFALVGTAVFAASNAALPMLELARQHAGAPAADRLVLETAATALLARGAHGSFGAFGGFFLSEIGTLLISVAMLRGTLFGRAPGLIGVVGATVLGFYTVAITFAPGSDALMKGVAAPAGLLMLAWYVLVARGLVRLPAE